MMEIDVLENKKNEAEFLIKGERHSFPNLLRSTLLKDSSVEFVSYSLNHPLDKDAKFFLKTKGKTPKKALEDALKSIESDLKSFKNAFLKADK